MTENVVTIHINGRRENNEIMDRLTQMELRLKQLESKKEEIPFHAVNSSVEEPKDYVEVKADGNNAE